MEIFCENSSWLLAVWLAGGWDFFWDLRLIILFLFWLLQVDVMNRVTYLYKNKTLEICEHETTKLFTILKNEKEYFFFNKGNEIVFCTHIEEMDRNQNTDFQKYPRNLTSGRYRIIACDETVRDMVIGTRGVFLFILGEKNIFYLKIGNVISRLVPFVLIYFNKVIILLLAWS